MPTDYSKLSDEELQRIVSGDKKDYSSMSDAELEAIVGAGVGEKKSAFNILRKNVPGVIMGPMGPLPDASTLARSGIGREMITPAAHFANQALFNAPRAMLERSGYSFPEAQTPVGDIASKAAGVAGAVVGPGKIERMIEGSSVKAPMMLKRAIGGGAIAGAYTTPENIEDPSQRIGQAGIGAVAAPVIGMLANAPKNVGRLYGEKQGADFARSIRSAFIKTKTNAVERFGSQLDDLASKNPNKTVSIRGVVDDIVSNINDMAPEAKSVFRKTPVLRDLIKNSDGADSVSLKDIQKISNYINSKVPRNIKANHIEIMDALSDIRAAQAEAFPEMAQLRAEYAKVAGPYSQVKNYFKFNRVLKAVENGFGGKEGMSAIRSLLPDNVIKEMGGYRAAIKIIRSVGNALKWGGILGGGYKALDKVFDANK